MVGRFSVLLMGSMTLSFLLSISDMIGHVSLDTLLEVEDGGQAIFAWGAASTYLTSFCFPASIPSLVKHLGKEPRTTNTCLRYGTSSPWPAFLLDCGGGGRQYPATAAMWTTSRRRQQT